MRPSVPSPRCALTLVTRVMFDANVIVSGIPADTGTMAAAARALVDCQVTGDAKLQRDRQLSGCGGV
jgi:hypothetical protein